MRRHPRPLRMLLILVGVLVVCSLVSQVTYGRWLQRTADALAMHSPIISYRYPGIYEGSARVGHVAAKVRVTMGAQGITAIEFLRRPFGKMDPLIDRIVAALSQLPQEQDGVVFRVFNYQNMKRITHLLLSRWAVPGDSR